MVAMDALLRSEGRVADAHGSMLAELCGVVAQLVIALDSLTLLRLATNFALATRETGTLFSHLRADRHLLELTLTFVALGAAASHLLCSEDAQGGSMYDLRHPEALAAAAKCAEERLPQTTAWGSFAVLLVGLKVLEVLRVLPDTSYISHLLFAVTGKLSQFLLVMGLVVLAFAGALFVRLGEHARQLRRGTRPQLCDWRKAPGGEPFCEVDVDFEDLRAMVLAVWAMVLGDFETATYEKNWVDLALFFGFTFAVSIIVLNLAIAIISDMYASVVRDAADRFHWRIAIASSVVDAELGLGWASAIAGTPSSTSELAMVSSVASQLRPPPHERQQYAATMPTGPSRTGFSLSALSGGHMDDGEGRWGGAEVNWRRLPFDRVSGEALVGWERDLPKHVVALSLVLCAACSGLACIAGRHAGLVLGSGVVAGATALATAALMAAFAAGVQTTVLLVVATGRARARTWGAWAKGTVATDSFVALAVLCAPLTAVVGFATSPAPAGAGTGASDNGMWLVVGFAVDVIASVLVLSLPQGLRMNLVIAPFSALSSVGLAAIAGAAVAATAAATVGDDVAPAVATASIAGAVFTLSLAAALVVAGPTVGPVVGPVAAWTAWLAPWLHDDNVSAAALAAACVGALVHTLALLSEATAEARWALLPGVEPGTRTELAAAGAHARPHWPATLAAATIAFLAVAVGRALAGGSRVAVVLGLINYPRLAAAVIAALCSPVLLLLAHAARGLWPLHKAPQLPRRRLRWVHVLLDKERFAGLRQGTGDDGDDAKSRARRS